MRFRRYILATAALMAAVAFTSACGGDDDGGEASGPTIKIGFSAWPGWFPWQVAAEEGIFEDAGVDVEMVYFEGYLDSINALAADQLDGNTQTLNDTIFSVSAGADQVIVLVNDNSTGNDAIIVSEGIGSMEDLKGKRIGLEEGVVDHYLLLLGLAEAGMSFDDVEIENLETGAAAAAFAAGQLDAVAVFAPFTTQALEREGSKVLFSSADFPGAIPDHLVLSRKLVDERPDDVQKIVDAWFMTLDWIEDNPDEALEIMAERAGVTVDEYKTYDAGTTLFTVEDNLAAFEPGDDLSHLDFAANDIMAFMLDAGLIDEEIDLARLFNSSFVEAYANADN